MFTRKEPSCWSSAYSTELLTGSVTEGDNNEKRSQTENPLWNTEHEKSQGRELHKHVIFEALFLSGNHNRRKRWWLPLSNFSEKNRETNAAFAY